MEKPLTDQEHDSAPAHEDEFVDHGWGDLKSWVPIVALCGGLIIISLICYHFVGEGMLTEWNLGNPPTAPNFLPF